MRLSRRSSSALLFSLLACACSDNSPTYPAIVIYGNPGDGTGTGTGATTGTGLTGSGDASSSGGSGNISNGGTSSAGSSGANDLFAHCGELWSGQDPPVGKVQCDMNALTDDGDLTGDITADRTLISGHSYSLKGGVRVMPGVTLTIEPCVKVIGQASDSVLAVLSGAVGDPNRQCFYASGKPTQGGKLMAVGEPMAPIVFTSSKPVGQRAPGDWGGVILMGNGFNNLALSDDGVSGTQVPIEGLARTECFGWPTDEFNTESSGKLQYVRIEYASRQLSADNETNGLTLGALGSGTELHYIEVSNSADDCMEWFGGAVNGDHLISLNCDDDEFDWDNGFSGKLQFLFGRQYQTTTEIDSRGFEIDGAPSPDNAPFTKAQASNFTVCGGGPTDKNSSRDGAVLRKSADVTLENGMVTGFAGSGLYVQSGSESATSSSMSYVQIFGNTGGLSTIRDVSPQNAGAVGADKGWFLNQPGNTAAAPDRFCDCWANPPVPVAASAGKGTKPTGFLDESADYVGAFKSPSPDSNWMRGAWVDWSSQ
jgi:hypothetical protein